MDRYSSELIKVKQTLRQSPRGMTVIELSRTLNINRNSMAKYLDVLVISGEVEYERIGPAKHFFLSQRMPLYEMLSVTSDCILIIDAFSIVTFANTAFLEVEGLNPDDVIGKKLSTLSLKMVNEEIASALNSANPGTTIIKELFINTDSKIRIFKLRIIGTVLHGGITGNTLFFEDITQKRLCQERLKSSEQLYRAVVEDQTEFIIRYLPDRTIKFVNEAYCRTFGVGQDDIIGTVFIPPIPPREMKRISSVFSEITADNPIVVNENSVILPDMTIAWHKWINRGIFDDEGELIEYQSVGRDITLNVQSEKVKVDLVFEISLLSDFTNGLLSINDSDHLFHYLGTYLKKTAPHSMITIVSFHKNWGTIKEVIQGSHWRNKRWTDFFESHLNKSFPCDQDIQYALSWNRLALIPPDVFNFQTISWTPFACLLKHLKQYEIHCIMIGHENYCYGSVIFISRIGSRPGPEDLIETMVNHTGAVLTRLNSSMNSGKIFGVMGNLISSAVLLICFGPSVLI